MAATSPVAVREAVGSGVGMFTDLQGLHFGKLRGAEFVADRITVACVLFPKRMRKPEWLPQLGLSTCQAGLGRELSSEGGKMFSRAQHNQVHRALAPQRQARC